MIDVKLSICGILFGILGGYLLGSSMRIIDKKEDKQSSDSKELQRYKDIFGEISYKEEEV